jgi:hypothetical protein
MKKTRIENKKMPVSCCQCRWAGFWIPRNLPGLWRAADCYGVNGCRVSVTVAVVLVSATVAGCPDENASFTFSASCDSVLECPCGQLTRSVDSLPVVVGAPRTRVDGDVIGIEAQGPGFNGIAHCGSNCNLLNLSEHPFQFFIMIFQM